MVTFSKGRRKGIAYVEYLDEVSPLHTHSFTPSFTRSAVAPPSLPFSPLPSPHLPQQSAQKAVEELDQFEVDGRRINVAISNPPRKGKQDVAMETMSSKTEPKKAMPPPTLIPSSV